ncbi:MAG: hypothetical protein ACE5IA_09225 [Dehalococcoidia bacterium]
MEWLEEAEQRLGKLLELVPARARQRLKVKVRAEAEDTARRVGGERVTAHHVTLGFVTTAPKRALQRLDRAGGEGGESMVWYEEYFH